MFVKVAKGVSVPLAVFAFLAAYSAAGYGLFQKSSYEDALDKMNHIRGVETCQSIPASTYETFLIFNPSNVQTYFFRSYCFQQVAVQTRDEKLCDQVKERKTIFLDGSGVSAMACRKAVIDRKNQDFAERVRPESVHKIERVEISSAPSGDIEVRVVPAGTVWGTYRFSVSLLDSSGIFVETLYDIETHLSNRNDALFISLQRKKIQTVLGRRNGCRQRFGIRIDLKLLRDDAGQLQRSNLSAPQLESTYNQNLSPKDTEPADCR